MKTRNILVLCKSNAARSIMVEACINARSNGNWRAESAGTEPASALNAYTLMALRERGLALEPERKPRSIESVGNVKVPRFDVVLTVCEDIDWESLPAWPGAPRLLHWVLPDPSAADCTPAERAEHFRAVLHLVEAKVAAFLEEERAAIRFNVRANDNQKERARVFGT